MGNIWIPALVMLLGTLVFFHELGHFIMAKLLKIRVEEFAFGFGPKWIRLFKRGETEYTIHPVPLGGFVKLAGQEPGEVDVPGGFMGKPWWARWLVYFAGPFMSFILAYLVFATLGLTIGLPAENKVENRVDLVLPGSEAMQRGLKIGDVFVSINGEHIDSGKEILRLVHNSADRLLTMVVRRDGEIKTIRATPQAILRLEFSKLGFTVELPAKDQATNYVYFVEPRSEAERLGIRRGDVLASINGERISSGREIIDLVNGSANKEMLMAVKRNRHLVEISATPGPEEIRAKTVGLLGFMLKPKFERVGLVESISAGNRATIGFIGAILGSVFSRDVGENVGGPLAIADATQQSVQRGPHGYLDLVAILSLSLGVLNLFPIPILDGGQMLLLIVEGIRGRRLSRRTMEIAQVIGLATIAAIFVLVMTLDLNRLFAGQIFR